MGEGRRWDYICGLYNKSVFEINAKNNCKDFKPKIGFIKKSWQRIKGITTN